MGISDSGTAWTEERIRSPGEWTVGKKSMAKSPFLTDGDKERQDQPDRDFKQERIEIGLIGIVSPY